MLSVPERETEASEECGDANVDRCEDYVGFSNVLRLKGIRAMLTHRGRAGRLNLPRARKRPATRQSSSCVLWGRSGGLRNPRPNTRGHKARRLAVRSTPRDRDTSNSRGDGRGRLNGRESLGSTITIDLSTF
jgi:hypothetical protein